MCAHHAAELAYLESLPTVAQLAAIKAAAKAEERKRLEERKKLLGPLWWFICW
jgi:hypothetical protein